MGVVSGLVEQMKYIVARRAWVGDYLDPNTYLDMYVTNGENNSTGFSNPQYDKLIADAAKEPDKTKRMQILETPNECLWTRCRSFRFTFTSREIGAAVRPRLL